MRNEIGDAPPRIPTMPIGICPATNAMPSRTSGGSMTVVGTRQAVVRRGINLSYLTILYNSVEAIGSLAAGIMAGSVSLIGFGSPAFG